MIYKTLKKVSNVCQLLDKSKYLATQTINGVTFTNNGDGTITVNGTATGRTVFRFVFDRVIISKGAKLRFNNALDVEAYNKFWVEVKLQYTDGTDKYIADVSITPSPPIKDVNEITGYIIVNDGETVNETLTPQLFDLTDMYGAGHEPTSVEQFRQDFPEEMYDYSPHCWATSYSRRLKVSNVCQLLDKSKYPATTTKEGITWTNNGDGTITANGTATAFTNILVDTVTPTIIKSGHKFLMLGCPLSNGNITTSKEYWMQEGYEFCSDHGVGGFFSLKGNNINLRIYIQKDYTADNLTFKPQIFDLTEMYGAGNEPTTVAQFRADFPNELYDYKPYSIVPSYKKSLICKTKNLLPYPYYETTITRHGVTFTDNRDGTITANGTSTGFATFVFSKNYNFIAGNTYYVSTQYSIIAYKENGTIYYIAGNKSFTWSSNWEVVQIYVQINKGITLNNLKIYPMINLGDTAADYVPYGHL